MKYSPEARGQIFGNTYENSPINPELDEEVQRDKASRLRQSPALRSLLDTVASDPDLRRTTQPVLSKAEKFKTDTVNTYQKFGSEGEIERFRNFAPLFAALRSSDRTSELLDLSADMTLQEDHDRFWQELKSGRTYVRELVIGTGAASANYLSTKTLMSKRDTTLAVATDFGGEFGITRDAAWKLNSRNRKSQRNVDPVPGTTGSLNELGKFATIQPSDYGHGAYQTQDELAHAIQDNLLLLGNTLTGVKVVGVRKNTNGEFGQLEVTLQNMADKDTTVVHSDRVVELSGLGEPDYGLTDQNSLDIIAQEREKLESKTEKPRVLHFNDFIKYVHDPANQFPLEGYKRITIVGDNDSALVAWGIIMGYEPVPGKTVRQVSEEPRVTIIAPNAPESREELLRRVRPRYAQMAVELPREDQFSYSSTFGRKGRVESLRRFRDEIEVIDSYYGQTDSDLVIFATGFEGANEDIYSELMNETITDRNEIRNRLRDVMYHPGSKIFFRNGKVMEIMDLEVTGRGQELKYREADRSGRAVSGSYLLIPASEYGKENPSTESIDYFRNVILEPGSISKIEYNSGISPEDVVLENDAGEPIAKKRDKYPIYKVGAGAKLGLPNRIRGAARRIPENAASIFVTSEQVTNLAKFFSEKDNKAQFPETLTEYSAELERQKLSYVRQVKTNPEIKMPITEIPEQLPIDLNSGDALKVIVSHLLDKYEFDNSIEPLKLTFSLPSKTEMAITVRSNLTQESNKEIIDRLMENDEFKEVIMRTLNYKSSRNKPVEVTIPFREIKLKAPKKRANQKRIDSYPAMKLDTGGITYRAA